MNKKVLDFYTYYIIIFTITYSFFSIYIKYFMKSENMNLCSIEFLIYIIFLILVLPMISIIYGFIFGLKNKLDFKKIIKITFQVFIYSIIQFTIMAGIYLILGSFFKMIYVIELALIQTAIFLISCLLAISFRKFIKLVSNFIKNNI